MNTVLGQDERACGAFQSGLRLARGAGKAVEAMRMAAPIPYPGATCFRRVDWRPGKRRRSKPRKHDYGGQKTAPLAFKLAGEVSGFGSGKHRRCRRQACRGWAMTGSDYCRMHGGARWQEPGTYVPRRLREARGNPKPKAGTRKGTREANPMAATKATSGHGKKQRGTLPENTAQLIEIAKQTLLDVCGQTQAPAAARAQAARTLLEMTGALKGHEARDTGKAQSEMSASEVESLLLRLGKAEKSEG